MSVTDFLDIVIHIVFIALGVLAIVDYLRHRNATQRDIAFMFGVLAIPFIFQLIARIQGEEVSTGGQMLSITALILEPYLLLRIVRYLQFVPAYMTRLAGVSLIATVIIGIWAGPRIPVIATLISQTYLISFNLYATVSFARGVLRSTGIQQQRLRFAAAGSGFFALFFIAALVSGSVSLPKDITLLFLEGLAGACAIAYYIGFAPPRWLRQTWQFDELHQFLRQTSRQFTYNRMVTFEQLSVAALRTVDGAAAAITTYDPYQENWRLILAGEPPLQTDRLDDELNAIGKAWKEQKADVVQVSHLPKDSVPDIYRWAKTLDARALFMIPIKGASHPWGLLIVALRNDPLFLRDDLELLTLLAEQSSIQLEYTALNQELQYHNESLEERVAVRTAELTASESNYRDLAESAQIGIFRAKVNGEVLYINERMAHMLGFDTPQAMMESGVKIRWQDPTNQQVFLQMLQQEGKVESFESVLTTVNGESFPMLISARLSGKQLTGTILDITERKQAEQAQQIYTEKLEQSNRDLQEFAYVASHDLQEPLRKVQAFSDRLSTKYASVLDETGNDYLKRMRDASQRMQTLINDLLTLSRVATRAQPFVIVNLNTVIHEVLSALENQIERANGRVETEELPQIEADPPQIHQLLQNLISNALKFHAPERAPVIGISAKIEGHSCRILVTDNGIGFETQYLDRIFKPFQRLHSREEYEGSGMGLAICRRIAERHGGTITATSTLGQGTTFIVILPIQQPKEKIDGKA